MTAAKTRSFRFSLRRLFLLIAAGAIMLWAGREFYEWYTSTPLANVIAAFNSWAEQDPVGKMEPPLTEEEVIAAIESQLRGLDDNPRVQEIYEHIVRTKRLPRSASLTGTTYSSSTAGPSLPVWWIDLDVMTGKTSGYSLRVRETDNPVIARGNGQSP